MKNFHPEYRLDLKFCLATLAFFLVFCVLSWYTISAAASLLNELNPCGNDIIKQEYSPDRRYKAIAFLRDCGATTVPTPEVSILPIDQDLPNEEGNVFINSYRTMVIDLKWISDSHLLILYEPSANPRRRQENSWSGIRIEYQPITPR